MILGERDIEVYQIKFILMIGNRLEVYPVDPIWRQNLKDRLRGFPQLDQSSIN